MVVSTMHPVRVLPHIERLDDCFGDFLVRHLPVRRVAPHRAGSARADRRGISDARGPGAADAMLELRQEGRRGGCGGEAEAAWRAEESALTKGSVFDLVPDPLNA